MACVCHVNVPVLVSIRRIDVYYRAEMRLTVC